VFTKAKAISLLCTQPRTAQCRNIELRLGQPLSIDLFHFQIKLTKTHSSAVSNDCDVAANGNTGCGVSFRKETSYGDNFNQFDGGYYAMSRTKSDGIRVWYWNRWAYSTKKRFNLTLIWH
jgi:hypothetical protein